MKKRNFKKYYSPKNYHIVQLLGWLIFLALFVFEYMAGRFSDEAGTGLPYRTAMGLLMLSVLLISLGNVLELQTHNRRIRPIELTAKAIPLPLIFLYLIIMFSNFREGEDILLELLIFIGFCVFICNIRSIYDFITRNREVVTCAEMKDLERQADEAGLSYLEMMENAGTEAFGYICEEERDWLEGMLIFCGSGNNGGDGFVIARKAMEYGCTSTVILPCGEPKTPDAITNYRRILAEASGDTTNRKKDSSEASGSVSNRQKDSSEASGSMSNRLKDSSEASGSVSNRQKDSSEASGSVTNRQKDSSDASGSCPVDIVILDEDTDLTEVLDPKNKVIVDSIFGTGFHGEPRGASKKAIEYINDLKHTNMIYAIDVPSGLPGDDGPLPDRDDATLLNRDDSPLGHDDATLPDRDDSTPPVFYNAVYADAVITFHARKPIHLNREPNTSSHIKKVIVADIGITRALDPTLQ